MHPRNLACASWVAFGAACTGGRQVESKPVVDVAVRVTSDPGKALADAALSSNGRKIAATKEDGVAKLRLSGNEGDTYEVTVTCPAGFQSPSKPIVIPVRRLSDPKKIPEYAVACPPTTRSVVIVVRAENGPNLPILYLGREIARTDSAGATSILFPQSKPGEQIDLVVGTTEKGNEQLRPQNPSATFSVKQQDDVFTLDQRFTVEAKPVIHYRPAPKPEGPIPLPTKRRPG